MNTVLGWTFTFNGKAGPGILQQHKGRRSSQQVLRDCVDGLPRAPAVPSKRSGPAPRCGTPADRIAACPAGCSSLDAAGSFRGELLSGEPFVEKPHAPGVGVRRPGPDESFDGYRTGRGDRCLRTAKSRPSYFKAKVRWPSRLAFGAWRGEQMRQPPPSHRGPADSWHGPEGVERRTVSASTRRTSVHHAARSGAHRTRHGESSTRVDRSSQSVGPAIHPCRKRCALHREDGARGAPTRHDVPCKRRCKGGGRLRTLSSNYYGRL